MAVYATAALQYWEKGWHGVLPLPPGKKYPPPEEYTGRHGQWPSIADIYAWTEDGPDCNIGIRLPRTVVGIDVDAYDGKSGAATLAHATELWGPLPDTVRSTARTDEVSGIRLFTIPEGVVLRDRIQFRSDDLGHIEVIQYHHRYAVSWPSIHPVVGMPYLWLDEAGTVTDIPRPDQLPELPQPWIDGLRRADLDDVEQSADVRAVLGGLVDGDMSDTVKEVLNKVGREIGAAGSRYDLTRDAVGKLLRMNEQAVKGVEQHSGIRTAQIILRSIYLAALAAEPGRHPESEYERMWTNRTIHDLIASTPSKTGHEENLEYAEMGGIDPATLPGPLTDEQQQDFWTARPYLSTIRQFAYARMCSPWAVLGIVLCRALATVRPYVTLPPLVGSRGSLNMFVALVGPPGAGKDAAFDAAADVYPGPTTFESDRIYVATLGSAEGIAHQYQHRATSGELKGQIVQDRESVLFFVSEVDTLVGLGNRSGSVLLPTLRSAFTGADISFGWADPTKRLRMDKHTYRLCLVMGVQPGKHAAPLMDDVGGGLPQRIVWLPAIDPGVQSDVPDEPFPVEPMPGSKWAGSMNDRTIAVPPEAQQLVRETRAAMARGETPDLNGHALFARLKVAAALAVLDHRTEIDSEDWRLSGLVMRKSDQTRDWVQRSVMQEAVQQNERMGEALGHQQVKAEEVHDKVRVQKVARTICRYLDRHGPTKIAALRRGTTSAQTRMYFQDALESMLESGEVVEKDEGFALPSE